MVLRPAGTVTLNDSQHLMRAFHPSRILLESDPKRAELKKSPSVIEGDFIYL
jgi:hypothetical protein